MKTKNYSKIALLLVLCLTALLAIGISASAEDAPVCKIESANVAYNDMLQLAFTVKSESTLPEGAEVGIIAWEAEVTEFTVATAFYATFTSSEKDGYTYYKTRGIAAPEMDTHIYVAACYRIGEGAITVAETPFKYSVLQYAGTRLAANVTAKQAELYENLIEYGMASDTVLEGEADYAFVRAVNGTIGSAGAKIGGWLGKEVLLRAEAKNADEEYFIKWVDADGNTVSDKRVTYVTVDKAGITEYTAVYGKRAESLYANTYNFEYLTTGKISTVPSGIGSLSNNDGVNNSYSITEAPDGDKQILIDRIKPGGSSYNLKFNLPSTQVAAFEYDLEFNESVANDVLNNIIYTLKDADGTTTSVRLNFNYNKSNQDFHIYMEGTGWTPVTDEDGKVARVPAPEGSTVTLTFALDLDNIKTVPVEVVTEYKKDEDGNYLDADGNVTTNSKLYVPLTTATYNSYTCDVVVYANGRKLGAVDLNECNKSGFYKETAQTFDANGVPAFLLDKDCTVTGSVGIGSLSAASKNISLDNFMYYDSYK